MNKLLYLNLLVAFLLNALPVFSQSDSLDLSDAISDNRSGLFESDKLLEITLRFNISLFRKTKSDNEYLDGELIYFRNGNEKITRRIKIRSRGEFRKNYCDFPPIMLNFRNEDTKDEFRKFNKLKLVTHCKAGNTEYLFKEYLVYKLYNILTDISFRVRLLKINYVNTQKPDRPLIEYAFIIEPVESMASRTSSSEYTSSRLTQKNIIPGMIDRLAIFNYMIGNYDWGVPIYHNVVILQQSGTKDPQLFAIAPYDFDYTGMVHPDYAVPGENVPISSIRERYFQGICRTREVYLKALDEFLVNKDNFLKTINEFPYMNNSSKKEMIAYLNSFYAEFDKRGTIVNNLLKNCKDL